MRRRRNPATMVHSLSCTDAEWERVRERADAAGLSMSRYLVERALTAELPRDGDGKIGPPPRYIFPPPLTLWARAQGKAFPCPRLPDRDLSVSN